MATAGAQSPTEYMVHHLTHNSSGKMSSIVDFSVINYDTVVFSVLLLLVSLLSPVFPVFLLLLESQSPPVFQMG